MREAPFFVAAPPRSGTTLVAWLLHLHGVWIGRAGVTKWPVTNSSVGTENLAITAVAKRETTPEVVRSAVLNIVPRDKSRWLYKKGILAIRWKVWSQAFPQALWVLPKRPLEDVVKSYLAHPGKAPSVDGNLERATHKLRKFAEGQKAISKNLPRHIWVDTDKLGRGDLEEAQRLIEGCGLVYNKQGCEDFIDPSIWHGS